MSRATQAIVPDPAWSTSSPGRLKFGSEVPRGQPASPGHSGSCPMARGVDHMSQATLARVRVPVVLSTLPGNSDSCPKNREVNHQSHATRARVRWSAGSTSCPSLLGPCSEGPRCRPALPSDSQSSPRARGVRQHSRATRAPVDGPHCRLALPGDSGPSLRSCGLDQMSRPTWGGVPLPAVSHSSPERLGALVRWPAMSTSVVDDLRSGPRAHGVDQPSRVTRARVR